MGCLWEYAAVGCRRGLWYAGPTEVPPVSSLPVAVHKCTPICLKAHRPYWVTTGVLPMPGTLSCCDGRAWHWSDASATSANFLLSALYLLTVQRMPTDWWWVQQALPDWDRLSVTPSSALAVAQRAPSELPAEWVCQGQPMPKATERQLWLMPLLQRHATFCHPGGRPLPCRAPGLCRCPCIAIAGALRAHFREFPFGAALPWDRFALDLVSRPMPHMQPWQHAPPAKPLPSLVFHIALGAYLPPDVIEYLPDDQELQRIAYELDFLAYERWGCAQGYTLDAVRAAGVH